MKYVLAIDLGGTKISEGIINSQGKILTKIVERTQIEKKSKGIIKQIIKIGKKLILASEYKVSGIGVGVPGPLNYKNGVVIYPPNLPNWKNVQLFNPIKKSFQLPIFLDNDANAAALGEWMFGNGRGTENMVYLTISTGIGGGIIIHKKLYHGQFAAGELGHMIIDPNGPKCSCGNYGCLEAFSSGKSFIREAKKAPQSSLIWKLSNHFSKVNASLVFKSAERGDKFAQKIVFNFLNALGIGIVNTIHILHPDKIILGGGVMNGKKYILPYLRSFVKKKVMVAFKKNIKIQSAKFVQDAGLIGAASLAISGLKKDKK